MKKILSLLLLASLLTGIFCGCSSDLAQKAADFFRGEEAAEQVEQAPQEEHLLNAALPEEEKELTFSLAWQPQYGLHPYNCVSLNNRSILSFVYESLFVVDDSFHAVPVLADSYDVSSDGTVTTVRLKSGVHFHDGSLLNANDVVYSLQSAKNSDYYGNRLRDVSEMQVVSSSELTLTTTCAYECLPLLLDIPIIRSNTADEPFPTGTGPYRRQSDTLLVRNTDWWQKKATPLVDVDEIPLVKAETVVDTRDQFEYANVNMVLSDPNSSAFAGFHNDYELWTVNTTILQYVGYNINDKVFSNYGLRSAITFAIDRETVVTEHANGFALPAVLPASPLADFYDVKLANAYDYNLRDFEKQLESAGVEDMDGDGILDLYVASLGYAVPVSGTMLVCSNSYQRVETARFLVESLNALGFDLTLETMEYDEFIRALSNGNFDLYYGEARLSANFDLSPFFSYGGSLSYGGLDDSTMLNLCNMALLNNGNTYTLYKRLCDRGYLTPVLFKSHALYTTRGYLVDPATYLDWFLPAPPKEKETT